MTTVRIGDWLKIMGAAVFIGEPEAEDEPAICCWCHVDVSPFDCMLLPVMFPPDHGFEPGKWAIDIGRAWPAILIVATPDSDAVRDGIPAGMVACSEEHAQKLVEYGRRFWQ